MLIMKKTKKHNIIKIFWENIEVNKRRFFTKEKYDLR
jgi:hypothetical protein